MKSTCDMQHDSVACVSVEVCDACVDERLSHYRPEILSGYGQADVDEDIEGEP